MGRKTVIVSDINGQEVEDGRGGKLRLTFEDARRGVIEWDVTGEEQEIQALMSSGRKVARRGRRPGTVA